MNWGHKIIIVFTLFAAGILTLVTKSMNTRLDLVTPDYYGEELKYQQVIDGRKQALNLSSPIAISQEEHTITLAFPSEMQNIPLTGNVLFYRASDSRQDVSLSLKKGLLIIDKNRLHKGNYRIQLKWQANGKQYFQENEMMVN
ncbi:FixH protein [Chitinophaga sp. CF118]|uniref:FixH family protein n=1 Tax=Chitinophaga sp. CF118 TaxID=1884367 RepID=UPI0008F2A33B|nr:FixH family protein [Chitinophaga sp. CF118]SFD33506.1 FixH protein [Chitinophaga sp. CF118]